MLPCSSPPRGRRCLPLDLAFFRVATVEANHPRSTATSPARADARACPPCRPRPRAQIGYALDARHVAPSANRHPRGDPRRPCHCEDQAKPERPPIRHQKASVQTLGPRALFPSAAASNRERGSQSRGRKKGARRRRGGGAPLEGGRRRACAPIGYFDAPARHCSATPRHGHGPPPHQALSSPSRQ